LTRIAARAEYDARHPSNPSSRKACPGYAEWARTPGLRESVLVEPARHTRFRVGAQR
jgi:hypothetical protein